MRKTTIFILSLTLILTALLCAGCNNNNGTNVFKIAEKNPLPKIEPYKEFDAKTAIIVEDGVEYSFEGYYSNSKGVEKDIVFNGSKFTINAANADVAIITVSAVKGKETDQKEIALSIQGNPDEIDYGVYGCYADGVITKTYNYDPKYIKEGDSSLKVAFSGYYEANEYGAQFSVMNGRLCTVEGKNCTYHDNDYSIYKYEDQEKAWEDAVMTFWVYYENTPKTDQETKLDIGYRALWHAGEPLPDDVQKDFDFGQPSVIVTQCALGEWTQIAIRFKNLNKVTPLYINEDRYKEGWTSDKQLNEICDLLSFKCRVKADDLISDDPDNSIKYNYSFYFDGLDVLTYSDFVEKYPEFELPDVDQGRVILPESIIRNVDFSNVATNFSSSGKAFVFDYKAIDDDTNTGDTVKFSLWGRNWGLPRRTELITVNVVTNEVTFKEESDGGEEPIDSVERSIGSVEELEDGWYRVCIPAGDLPINTTEEATGEETIGMIYFNEVEHAFEVNNIGFVEVDS